jgi:HK97 gp10 family phage protein
MAGRVNWYGKAVKARIDAELSRRVKAASIVVQNHAKGLISKGGLGGKHSPPGDPPFVQTGRLRGSVAHEVVGLIGRVGTNVIYGRFLEFGTRRMAARPWLRRALAEMRAAITAILTKRIN